MSGTKHFDLVAPFVAGYDTQYFFTEKNVPIKPTLAEITAFGGIAVSQDVGLDIKAFAFENGMILFDFSECKITPVIINLESIYEKINPESKISSDVRKNLISQLKRSESKQSENQAFYKTISISHALLLENSARILRGMSMSLPHIEDQSALVLGHAPEKMMARIPFRSSVSLGTSVADHSFSMLADAISKGLHVIRSLELHKVSHYRFISRNFAECLVMSWTLCENMIDFIWKKMIEDIKFSNPDRMEKARIDRLKAQAFTASVRIETLELSGRLDLNQAHALNFVRKARNNWLHALKEVKENEALESIRICEELITSLYGIPIKWTIGGAGGSGGGMFMDVFLERYGAAKLNNVYDGS